MNVIPPPPPHDGLAALLFNPGSDYADEIDLSAIRRLSSLGLPESGSHRALVYRLLLGYLPPQSSMWPSVLKKSRDEYDGFVREFYEPVMEREERKGGVKADCGGGGGGGVAGRLDWCGFGEEGWTRNGDNGIVGKNENIVSQIIDKCENGNGTGNDGRSEEPKSVEKLDDVDDLLGLLSSNVGSDDDNNTTNNTNNTSNTNITNNTNDSNDSNDSTTATTKRPNPDAEEAAKIRLEIEKEKKKMTRRSLSSSSISCSTDTRTSAEAASILLQEIRKDVVRTHPDIQFFIDPDFSRERYAALERILFTWASLNRGIGYVQGMNEVVGTVYYVLRSDTNEEWSEFAEHDTYHICNTLLNEMRDMFVSDLDEADTGVMGAINSMISLLDKHDPELNQYLNSNAIEPTFYSIRWLTTLLSREFHLPDTIRLWDSLFACRHHSNFLRYFCVTMLMGVRSQILGSDFAEILKILQNYPAVDIDVMLDASNDLWSFDRRVMVCISEGNSLKNALSLCQPPPSKIVYAFGLEGGWVPQHHSEMVMNGAFQVSEKAASAVNNAAGVVGRWGSRFLNDVKGSAKVQQEKAREALERREVERARRQKAHSERITREEERKNNGDVIGGDGVSDGGRNDENGVSDDDINVNLDVNGGGGGGQVGRDHAHSDNDHVDSSMAGKPAKKTAANPNGYTVEELDFL